MRTSKGIALAFALALFPLLLVLGLAFMSLAGVDYGFAGQAATRIRAFYLADAGARYAYHERARWRTPYIENWSLSTGDVRIRIEPRQTATGLFTGTTVITSTGRSGWITVRVVVEVDYTGRILIWDEQGAQW